MEAARSCSFAARLSRITGFTIGWLGVLVSVGLIYSLCEQPGHFGKSLHETIIAFLPGLNLVASYSWLFGIDRNKPPFMLAALVWWGTNLCLVLVCIFSFIAINGNKPNPLDHAVYFLAATVYWVCSYIVAVLCYKSIRTVDHKIPEVDV